MGFPSSAAERGWCVSWNPKVCSKQFMKCLEIWNCSNANPCLWNCWFQRPWPMEQIRNHPSLPTASRMRSGKKLSRRSTNGLARRAGITVLSAAAGGFHPEDLYNVTLKGLFVFWMLFVQRQNLSFSSPASQAKSAAMFWFPASAAWTIVPLSSRNGSACFNRLSRSMLIIILQHYNLNKDCDPMIPSIGLSLQTSNRIQVSGKLGRLSFDTPSIQSGIWISKFWLFTSKRSKISGTAPMRLHHSRGRRRWMLRWQNSAPKQRAAATVRWPSWLLPFKRWSRIRTSILLKSWWSYK